MTCEWHAPCLGEMLYGSVHMTLVLFNGGHVPIDGACLLWLTTVLQQLQRLLALAYGILWSALSLIDPAEQKGHTN